MVIIVDKLYFIAKCVIINDKNQILILKRTDYKNNGTENLWDFPGGNIEKYEDVNISIKREVFEETKIELNSTKIVSIDSGKKDENEEIIFVIFASKDYKINEQIILSEEHLEYKWITVDEIDNYDFYLKPERLEKIKNYLIKNN